MRSLGLTDDQNAVLALLRREKAPLSSAEIREWSRALKPDNAIRSLARKNLIVKNANGYWSAT